MVARNPLREVATDPKRYQVTFLGAEPKADALQRAQGLAGEDEQLVADGLELYAWHPGGVARSKLWGFRRRPGTRRHRHGPELEHGDQAALAGRRVAPQRDAAYATSDCTIAWTSSSSSWSLFSDAGAHA